MDKLELYEKGRKVPEEAAKEIKGGRLKGFTDINPMWRIKMLTSLFGPVGVGWYYQITDKRIEKGGGNDVAVFVQIDLFYKLKDEWSKPIVGIGGSSFVTTESKGLYTSDECFKMALTDAISVACKSLGIGADVYFKKDCSKYDRKDEPSDPYREQRNFIINYMESHTEYKVNIFNHYHLTDYADLTPDLIRHVVVNLRKKGEPI